MIQWLLFAALLASTPQPQTAPHRYIWRGFITARPYHTMATHPKNEWERDEWIGHPIRCGDEEMEQELYYDESGTPYTLDANGNRIPPMQTPNSQTSSGFTTYDTSQGHCALCGRLDCKGGCFK